MTPVLKKNKDRQNPANYRGITVTKIFTKIIQSILKSRVDIQIDQIQNPLQRGFTEAIPMLFEHPLHFCSARLICHQYLAISLALNS
jgi:hypothetical protein